MKTSKCLMGILLSSVLLIGSVFAANTLTQDVKNGLIQKKSEFEENSTIRLISPEIGNSNRDCTDCEFDFTPYGSECCDSAWDEFGINCADLEANYNWDCSGCACPGDEAGECGDGNCNINEDCETCEADCGVCGECDAGFVADCADNDCCPESWIGDGFADCEDQAYGCDLTCYDMDGGDCADPVCGDGVCNGSETEADCPEDCTAGSECSEGFCDEGTYWDGFSCYDCGYCTDVSDDSACDDPYDCCGMCGGSADGDGACGDPVCGDGYCNGDESYETCPDDCTAPGECDPGYITDCVDDDCCPESWIGDGFEDCEDQAYGCDLTCYDDDGGDCAPACDEGLIECWDGSCVANEADCPDFTCDEGYVDDCADDDCCPETWIGDGLCDGEDQAWGCDLTCYESDGGDCEDCDANTCGDGLCQCGETNADCPADCAYVEPPTGVCIEGADYLGYPAITVSWDIETECGDGFCNGDEVCDTGDGSGCEADCGICGECEPGYITDCADDDCCPESWIGDGFADCEDQAYGCDLTCYDNDGGDCDGGTTGGTTGGTETCDDCEFDFTAYGSECCDTAWDEFGINCADLEANYNWDCSGCSCPGDEGGTTTTGGGDCDAGYVEDCVDDDCCPESWIGDGFEDCEDQAYGCDLTCYDNDGGDCDGSTTTGGTTGGTEACEDCEFDFTAYGSECCDTAWDEFGIDCVTLEANYNWDCSGCSCPGDIPCADQGLIECEWGAIDGGNCAEDESGCLEAGDCPAGQIADCDGSGECWPESWIGDGFPDCEDQQYGADLTCYDNDGGDCGEQTSCEDQGLVTCFDGSCAATTDECVECPAGTIADCSGDGDCGYETWLGDGYCDGSSQQYGIDNCCYDNDGGDCTDEECAGGRAQVSSEFKKGHEPTNLHKGRMVDVIRAEAQSAISLRDGVVIHNGGAVVRMNEVIDPSTRAITAEVALSCDACLSGGPWSGSWIVDALAFGYFTVYGFDAGSDVCGTVTFCDDQSGDCSETSDEVCAVAGDASTGECVDDGPDCPSDAGSGDVNADGNSDVLDIVQIVNVILGGAFADDCAAAAADVNGDGSADVLDIVQIVNGILGRSDIGDATHGTLIKSDNALRLEANGYIGGVQMTLEHDADFSIELSEAWLADYRTIGNETKLVIVAPEGEELFTFTGDFEIVDMIVANSEDRVNVGPPTEFSLSAAYPNPFNPTTSMTLAVPEAGNVTVQVYNIMGQVVATLANGYMDASTYTLTWDASQTASGMYFVKAEAAGSVTTQKLVLMK